MFKHITISLFGSHLNICSSSNNNIRGACIDSRQVKSGEVFFALKGSFEEVHSYSKKAFENGAILVVSKYSISFMESFQVDDVVSALTKLASLNRSFFRGKMIALTGSNGKTTVKNLLFHLLNSVYFGSVFATAGNLNNHLGVPLSLCNLNENHEFSILEVGANHLGEVSSLSNIIKPDICLITSISNSHLGEFGSLDNIIKSKLEIIYSLDKNKGKFFLSSTLLLDNFLLIKSTAQSYLQNVYIVEDILDITKTSVENFKNKIDFFYKGKIFNVVFDLLGIHNAYNLRLALGIILTITDIDQNILFQSLNKFCNDKGRGQIFYVGNNIIIDESYNANPSSVKALIDSISYLKNRKILVLGNMNELGVDSEKLHKDIGKYSIGKIDKIFAFGNLAKFVKESFKNTLFFDNFDGILEEIQKESDAIIVIKGSRSNKLELLVKKIINE